MNGGLEQNAPLRAESTGPDRLTRRPGDPAGPPDAPMRGEGPRLASRAPEPEEDPG